MFLIEVSPNAQLLIGSIEQAKLSDEQASAMATFLADLIEAARKGKLEELDRDDFRGNLNLSKVLPEPTITQLSGVVLPAKDVPVQQRVADGHYDWTNSDINGERFLITLDAGPADLYIAHFGVDVENDDVEAWATAHGYTVALVEELFAVGAHSEYGKFQLDFPIIALGSSTVVYGRVDVPGLSRRGSEREPYLRYRGGGWDDRCRFLLRKVS